MEAWGRRRSRRCRRLRRPLRRSSRWRIRKWDCECAEWRTRGCPEILRKGVFKGKLIESALYLVSNFICKVCLSYTYIIMILIIFLYYILYSCKLCINLNCKLTNFVLY